MLKKKRQNTPKNTINSFFNMTTFDQMLQNVKKNICKTPNPISLTVFIGFNSFELSHIAIDAQQHYHFY